MLVFKRYSGESVQVRAKTVSGQYIWRLLTILTIHENGFIYVKWEGTTVCIGTGEWTDLDFFGFPVRVTNVKRHGRSVVVGFEAASFILIQRDGFKGSLK